jgi:hypothetical protein
MCSLPIEENYVKFDVFTAGMLHHDVLVKTEVSEEHSASIVRLTRIGELGTALAVTIN